MSNITADIPNNTDATKDLLEDQRDNSGYAEMSKEDLDALDALREHFQARLEDVAKGLEADEVARLREHVQALLDVERGGIAKHALRRLRGIAHAYVEHTFRVNVSREQLYDEAGLNTFIVETVSRLIHRVRGEEAAAVYRRVVDIPFEERRGYLRLRAQALHALLDGDWRAYEQARCAQRGLVAGWASR